MRLLLLVLTTSAAFAQDPVGFGFLFHSDDRGWLVVTGVAPGGAAEAAGLESGDLLVTVAGDSVYAGRSGLEQLRAARESLPAAFRVARGRDTLGLALGVAPYSPAALLRASNAYLCLAGDCWNGAGLWRSPDGEWYDGTFREGLRDGAGVLTLADGRIHSGGYARGVFHGRGTYFWRDGSRWTGTFADDQPQPPGLYTDPSGASRAGLPD